MSQIQFQGGKTNIADGLRTMRTELFGGSGNRAEADDIAIVITDGGANINKDVSSTACKELYG